MFLINLHMNFFLSVFQDFFFVRSTEFALVSQKTESITLPPKGNKPQCENYFVGLVITHNPNTDTDRQTLKLNYFIVLTSQAELFPTDPVESKSGEFKAMVLQELSGSVRSRSLAVRYFNFIWNIISNHADPVSRFCSLQAWLFDHIKRMYVVNLDLGLQVCFFFYMYDIYV